MVIPKVSISCITYNHAPYLKDCFEGFLMQKTDFAFEILVHDDASTDSTREVIEEYTAKYPDLFFPIYQQENQYSKGVRGMMFRFNFPRARGKYIALCEGDDFWTDPYKLQKQVDFLEKNIDCVCCFHAHNILQNDRIIKIGKPRKISQDSKFSIQYIFQNEGGAIATNSILFLRKYSVDLPDWALKSPVGDLPLFLHLGTKGKIGYINEVMSTYRFMSNNSWSVKFSESLKFRIKTYLNIIHTYKSFNNSTNFKYNYFVSKNILSYYFKIILSSLSSLLKIFISGALNAFKFLNRFLSR
ncbi:glycosyltransferase family 2 protein [Aquirufa antheringensis]